MGDINMTLDDSNFNELIEDHELSTLISEPTCFNSINPTCTDNFLRSKMLRSTFARGKPEKIFYHCYKNFDNKKFEEKLKKHLSSMLDFESFHLAFETTLDRFEPLQQKVVRNKNQPFITKALRKAIMKRSKLKNKFNKG